MQAQGEVTDAAVKAVLAVVQAILGNTPTMLRVSALHYSTRISEVQGGFGCWLQLMHYIDLLFQMEFGTQSLEINLRQIVALLEMSIE